ncbi:MAG: hypothetical protein HFH76_05405 [Lachnospiraceae bacterium]|nr:hypothetical protein [Lachnospiraceae bacterium]
MAEYVKQSREYDMRIASGAAAREKDRAIWKSYSKRGGIHDALQDFCRAVRRPSANAFDYDEEDRTYIICITLYNTIWMQMDQEIAKLDQNLTAIEVQKQNYVPATRTRTYTKVRKTPGSKKPQPDRNTNGILRFFKALDQRMMHFKPYAALRRAMITLDKVMVRFKPYAAVRSAIAGVFSSPGTDTAAPVMERYECTETVYEEGEVELASYQGVHSRLLDILRDIAADIGKNLPLIQGEDQQALEQYQQEAQRICSSIEKKVFSRQEWVL